MQVIAGFIVGILLMVTVDYPCLEFRMNGSCGRYAYAWETAQWNAGLIILFSSIVYGSAVIMIAAYINSRTSDSSSN